ncbi:MAG: VWA domain-containing protein [Pseudomonadota bacterium]
MFRFASPLFLLLLSVIPLAVYLNRKYRHGSRLRVSSLTGLEKAPATAAVLLVRYLPLIKYTALALLILALARPQWGTRKVTIQTEGINIILALDLSESMAALDFKLKGAIVNRLEAVKDVVKGFILKRDGDRIGMVVFGSQAFTQIPLTRDYNTISFILDRLKIGAAGPSTAIGDAIGISLKRLQDIKSKSNIIILLTDGKSNSGELSPETAADIAAERGVRIYTIGVGTQGKAPFLVKDPVFGQRYVYQQVEIDHETLKALAAKTQGRFFAAQDTEALNQIYDIIDGLEKTEADVKAWTDYNEFYFGLVLVGFCLVGLVIVLANTRLLRIP